MITVLTPAYNRAKTLSRLYDSLVNQTYKNFKWVIVDDGSIDETKEVVDKFIKENKLDIKFYAKENGGKHTALNLGVQKINTELTYVVDSDDYLPNDAIETIVNDYQKIKDNKELAGLAYLKADANLQVVGKPYTQDGIIDNFTNQRINNNTYGDKAEVFKTEVLKQYPFPVFEGENFVSESTVWCKISLDYKMAFYNKVTYICEYQQGGLSDGVHKRLFKNPKGASACYVSMSSKQVKFLKRLKYTIAFIVYSFAAKMKAKQQFQKISSKFCYVLGFVPAWFIYLKKKRNYKD